MCKAASEFCWICQETTLKLEIALSKHVFLYHLHQISSDPGIMYPEMFMQHSKWSRLTIGNCFEKPTIGMINRYHLRIFQQFPHQTLDYLNGNKLFLTLKGLWQINARFGIKVWNLGPILVNKVLQKWQ